jgi:hypothetical protein
MVFVLRNGDYMTNSNEAKIICEELGIDYEGVRKIILSHLMICRAEELEKVKEHFWGCEEDLQ